MVFRIELDDYWFLRFQASCEFPSASWEFEVALRAKSQDRAEGAGVKGRASSDSTVFDLICQNPQARAQVKASPVRT